MHIIILTLYTCLLFLNVMLKMFVFLKKTLNFNSKSEDGIFRKLKIFKNLSLTVVLIQQVSNSNK